MIQLKPNANQIVKNLIRADGVIAFYKNLCQQYAEDHVQVFITDLQNLITKLGIVISKVSRSNISISYCVQAINFLCCKVLDNPSLEKQFDSLGLNEKGNQGKHNITTNRIDMDRAVVLFNSLVNGIASKYNLFALKELIVSKRSNSSKQNTSNHSSNRSSGGPYIYPSANDKPSYASDPIHKVLRAANGHAEVKDERISLTAELVNGDGRYQKGLFHKVGMLNFILKLDIYNPDELKITDVYATFKCKGNVYRKRIISPETEIDLETDKFSGNIVASISATYKIGVFKTKTIQATVSKIFN